MSSKAADRVKETSTTTGTGTLTLAGAVSGFRTFASGIGVGNTCWYAIFGSGGEWETGLGTVASSNTLTRDTVYASSNSGSLVNFSSGSKDVFVTLPASQIVEGPSSSVDSEIALFSGTGGKTIKRATTTGILKAASGVVSAATAGTDYVSPALAGSVSHVFPYSASESYFYFGTSQAPNLNHASTLVANRLYVVQFTCPNNASVLRDLSAYVVTGVGGTSIRWGIYTANATTFLPDSLVANTDSGDQSSATSSTLRTFTPGSTVTLTKGQLYFIALHSDGAPSLRASNTTGYTIAGSDLSSTGWFSAFYVSQTYGAMPSTFPAGTRTYVSGGAASAFAAMVGARFTS